jgi:surfeit locus 1 family protein
MRASIGIRRFRPRLGPSLATLVGVALRLGLGSWQVQRLHWKEGLIAARAAQLAAPHEPLPAASAD